MSPARVHAEERPGADDLSLLLHAARRERLRRQPLRKAGAFGGGGLAAFLVAAGVEAEARETRDFAQADAGVSTDEFRVADVGDILSFAEICATEGEGSIFNHAVHAGSLLAASFEEGFASRLASRFAAEHGDDHADVHAPDSHAAAHTSEPSHRAMAAHASHAEASGIAPGHGGHQGSAGASEAPAAHSSHQGGDAVFAPVAIAAHDGHGVAVADNAGGLVELHTTDHGGGVADDGDLAVALQAFLGEADTAPADAPPPASTPQADHAHATLADAAVAEIIVTPVAEI